MTINNLTALGFPAEADDFLQAVRSAERRDVERIERSEPEDLLLSSFKHGSNGSMYHNAAMAAYLLGDYEHAREFGRKCAVAYDHYLFGQWRSIVPAGNRRESPPDEDWQRLNGDWKEQWWIAIHWNSVLKQWEGVERLLSFPDVDLLQRLLRQVEKHVVSLSWPILVGLALSGRRPREVERLHNVIGESSQRNERMLLPVLEAIVEGSSEATARELEDYLDWFRRARRPRKTFNDKLSLEAGFLKNYAEYVSLDVSVSERNQDLFVHPHRLQP